MRGSRQHFAFHGRQNRQISTFGRVNRRSSWEKTHRRRSAWRDLDQSGNSSGISKMCRKISDFTKILKMLRLIRFGAATTNDERGAGRGSARTIGPRARKIFSPIFPPDPTSEIGKIWKHYDYPRLADPVFPVLQWGNCQSRKSSEFWIFRNFLCLPPSYNYCWRIPPESPRIIKFSGGRR